MSSNKFGTQVFAPVLTCFNDDGSVNQSASIKFCQWLLSQGAGLALFGTNSEAASLALTEKRSLLDLAVESGLDTQRMIPGTGLCALPEAIEMTKAAVDAGCAGTLTLPPWFFKPASDDGLFAYYSSIIEAVGSSRLKVYLYHIPQFTGVPITRTLIERLIKAYPETVVGLKDSSGDWANTEMLLREFPGFRVFPASEALLEKALPLGAAGCISATANVQPGAIVKALSAWDSEAFAPAQKAVTTIRMIFQSTPMIPSLKYLVGENMGDKSWRNVRPPLTAIDAKYGADLLKNLSDNGYAWSAA